MERGPFSWVDTDCQGRVLAVLSVLVIASTAWLVWVGQVLFTPAAPDGIVSFELARSLEASAAILDSWTLQARFAALLIQGFDYLYLLLYPAWFSLAASRLGAALGGRWRSAAAITAWGVLLAAPLDAIENYALIVQLLHGPDAVHAAIAWWCAAPKFLLVFGAMLYTCAAGIAWVWGLLRRRSRA